MTELTISAEAIMVDKTEFEDLKKLVEDTNAALVLMQAQSVADKTQIQALTSQLIIAQQTNPQQVKQEAKIELEKRLTEQAAKLEQLEIQKADLDTQIQDETEELNKIRQQIIDLDVCQSSGPYKGSGKEEQITTKFGEVLTPNALKEFMDDYKMARYLNQKERLINWDDSMYRATKLRRALQGTAASYVRGEKAMGQTWPDNDDEILDRLKERYLTTEAYESMVAEAEAIRQNDSEPLPEYMSRIQRAIWEAYDDEPSQVKNKRTMWKFMDGLKNKEIRSEIIKSKWLNKTPDEILLIAETTRKNMEATSVTGKGKQGAIGGVTSNNSKKQPTKKKEHVLCLYCKRTHPGGWQKCFKRMRENSEWVPDNEKSGKDEKKQGFQ